SRFVSKKLRNRQVKRQGNLRQCVQRRHRVAVLHARKIATQQAGLLLDIPLRKPLLEPVRTNRGANLDHEKGPVWVPGGVTSTVATSELLAQELTWPDCECKGNSFP